MFRPLLKRASTLAAMATAAVAHTHAAPPSFDKDIEPLLAQFCYDCHGDGVDKGDLELDGDTSAKHILENRAVWETVLYNVENWVMPPPDRKRQPTQDQRDTLVSYLDNLLFYCDCDNPDPGRVTIRRLNREEYNNTTRDLIGIDQRPADEFPADDTGYGFDTIGDVLSLPPILMERYLMAADKLLDAAIVAGPPEPSKRTYKPSLLKGGQRSGTNLRSLTTNGTISVSHDFPYAGDYIIHTLAHGDQAGDGPVALAFTVDGNEASKKTTRATSIRPEKISAKINLPKGRHSIGIAFLNDFYDASRKQDRNLHLAHIEIEGPFGTETEDLPESHKRIFIADPEKVGQSVAARKIVRNFANRAFRRPAKTDEVERLVAFVDFAKRRGDTFEMGIKQALRAVMVSPHFLFRIEWQPEPDNPARIHQISEFALASRLSYFLWSSMPDDQLLSLAFNNKLRAQLDAQIERMLADPKSGALAENFAGQWLELRNLLIHQPDAATFPSYSPELAADLKRETEALFNHILLQNRPVLEFLDADYTFINSRLAAHYGIGGVTGSNFQRVSLVGTPRRGILTHGSTLTITSDPNRTSPVKRGKWVLDNILGTPPPPPPPNVPPLGEEGSAEATGPLRKRLEAHRENPACSGCHSLMDPLGFGLENFDAIGRYRTTDGGIPVDPSGKLVTGQTFQSPSGLADIILEEKRDLFVRCLIKKLLTYSLGRGVEWYDKCAINEISATLEKDDYRFQTLIRAIIESTPFQFRRGDGFRPYQTPATN